MTKAEKRKATFRVHRERDAKWNARPTVYITGHEETAFDYFDPIRSAYRKQFNYIGYQEIIRRITGKLIWQDISKIDMILHEYASVVVGIPPKKEKVPMSEEAKARLREYMKNKKDIKKRG